MSTRAEISGGAIFLPCASTQASPLSAFTILYGTILMSRCTTSSSNLRPMRRLMANRVLCGLVTAWRLAGWPTSTSLSLVKATIEGVVRSPSLFSITRGLPPSMMATHELVVPRSMPITFAMCLLRRNLFLKGDDVDVLLGCSQRRFKAGRPLFEALDRGSCPAQRCFGQKAWFLPKAPPPAAAGHVHVPNLRARHNRFVTGR